MTPEEEAGLRLTFARLPSEGGAVSPVDATPFMETYAKGWEEEWWHPDAKLFPTFEFPNQPRLCLATGLNTLWEERIITRYSGGSPKGERRVQTRFAIPDDVWGLITESLQNCREDIACTSDPELERLAWREALFFYREFLAQTFQQPVSQYYIGDYVPDRYGWAGNILQMGLNTTYNCIDEVENTIEISRLLYLAHLIPNHRPTWRIEYREEPAYSKYATERHGVLPIAELDALSHSTRLFGIDLWEQTDPQFIPMEDWRHGAATAIIPLWDDLSPVFFGNRNYQDDLNSLLMAHRDLSDFVSATEYQIDLQGLAISKADTLDYGVFGEIRTEANQLQALPKLRFSSAPLFYIQWYLKWHAVSDSVRKQIEKIDEVVAR